MGQISLQVPVSGLPNSTEDPKIASDFTTLQTLVNGNLDATNIADTLAAAAGVNTSDQVVKGVTNIAASQATSSTTYTTLATPDQVSNVVLASNGILEVWYQATWQESVAAAARAAIFIGSNQLQVVHGSARGASAAMINGGSGGADKPLMSFPAGLVSPSSGVYSGDATTGQAVVLVAQDGISPTNAFEANGATVLLTSTSVPAGGPSGLPVGGPCHIFAAAGTYAVSVKFKASSGTVTASNRRLWVRALSFA